MYIWKTLFISSLVFILAFILRVVLIIQPVDLADQLDLEIYRAGGALILNHVNPYNHKDKVEIRERLREETKNDWFKKTQDRWNNYAGSNLPLNLLFFGSLSLINHKPIFYRLVFAFFDSLLSAVAFFMVVIYWQEKNLFEQSLKIISGLMLVAISPIILTWGTIISEEKGIEILLLMLALLCSFSQKKWVWFFLGGFVLGLSIAFKGLGIFLLPVFIKKIIEERKKYIQDLILFIVFTGLVAFIWFVPFIPYVFQMMFFRLWENSVSTSRASSWVFLYPIIPTFWNVLRITIIISGLIIGFTGYFKKKIGICALCGTLLLLFSVVYLTKGMIDRMNIGITISIFLLGKENTSLGIFLALFYFLAGTIAVFFRSDTSEGLFVLFYLVFYFFSLSWLIVKNKSKSFAS